MTKRASYIAAILLTSGLVSPAAWAQVAAPSEPTRADASEDIEDGAVAPAGDDSIDDAQDVDISAPGASGNEIIVRGRFIPNPIRATSEVVAVLGQEEIARTAEGDIAGSLSRVTGLSVVGGRFVFVRGLGERYSLALLNGNPLPSPEPLRRVVPLDLFPTSVIASTVVQKSYSANYPGEFGGGVINLTTKSNVDESFLEISTSISANTETTNKTGYTYDGSSYDWFGFDSGLRDIPTELQSAIDKNVLIAPDGVNFSSEDLQQLGQSLVNAQTSLIQRNFDIPANFSGEITGGHAFEIGETLFGIFATAGLSNSWRTRGGLQQQTQGIVQIDGQDGLLPDRNFQYLTTQNRIVANGMIGINAEVGEHKFRFVNLYIRDTVKESSISAGIDAISVDPNQALNTGRTSWFERQLFSSQLVGEFEFDRLSVDVRGSYSNSQREAPYERTYSYLVEPQTPGGQPLNRLVNDLTSPGQSARIRFSNLVDDVYGAGADLGYELGTAIPITVSGGYNYYKNIRAAERRDFRFIPANGLPFGLNLARIDTLLSAAVIDAFDIELREVGAQNSVPRYTAELEVQAGYVQADAELADGLRLNLGVRYEDADQIVAPISLAGGAPTPATTLSNSYWLPAGTLTWNFADDMQFRFAASRTIARPQFRELAPQQFLDLETDRTFIGNPLLTDSELTNVEARLEYYIGRGERLTMAGFYKDIKNPIESVAFIQGGGAFFQGFSNAPSAQLVGVEFEAVKYFPLYDLGGSFWEDRRLMLAANYTFTDSKIKVGADDLAISPITFQPIAASNLFSDGDRLTGQSKHVANVQFGLEQEGDDLSQQTILLTYNSPRATARGPQDQPDLIEKTGLQVDFVMREGAVIFGQQLEFKFEARNIFGESYTESQTLNDSVIINNGYDYGTSFSFSVALKF
ncbi:TonB-dependent receptor domain-containing protein [Parasphingorhabdus sp.]|jgi:outer membrane receptor protein involved in Fe transport|uniref:TonB-dependent receptor domain-containing protein n=1 Tax=Parasphingorhabdus sp. TaxID=2709688 RepID=UPI0007F3D5DB|nr:TonB-dependent receptor [Sphingomonadales bacterium EhC05]